jgi:hypothetical protein
MMQRKKTIIKWMILLITVLCVESKAAYRVYQLEVTALDERKKPQKKQVVLSILNQFQYENYHGYGTMRVVLVDSWFCPGDTSKEEYCKKPKNKALQRGPAGLLAPKRKRPEPTSFQ